MKEKEKIQSYVKRNPCGENTNTRNIILKGVVLSA